MTLSFPEHTGPSFIVTKVERKLGDGSPYHTRGCIEAALMAGSEVRSTQLKHLFKHRVNRSSLAGLPFPFGHVLHSLGAACLEEEVEGLLLPPGHSQPHSLRLTYFEIHRPEAGQMALVCANALCTLKVSLFSIWKVSTSFDCLTSGLREGPNRL